MKSGNDQPELLTRREAILRVSAMLGGVALVGQTAMLAGTRRSEAQTQDALFTDADIALLDEIAETILPETGTPGAKAAAVGPFMAMMVVDTYFDRDQEVFAAGLKAVDERCQAAHGTGFMEASPAERLTLLEELDAEQHEYLSSDEERDSAHFFRMMKELALFGYFTSEIGYTQAMRYTETPGRFDPCTDYKPGDKAWAPHA
jgi:hypothetical protein